MVLAGLDPAVFEKVQLLAEEVQLLADCFAPVFATEIPIAAEMLMMRGLLRALTVRRSHTCFLLAITDDGRWEVEKWIEQHGHAAQGCDTEPVQMARLPDQSRPIVLWTLNQDTKPQPFTVVAVRFMGDMGRVFEREGSGYAWRVTGENRKFRSPLLSGHTCRYEIIANVLPRYLEVGVHKELLEDGCLWRPAGNFLKRITSSHIGPVSITI